MGVRLMRIFMVSPSAIPGNCGDLATMTSREVAELFGKRHDHVLRDIDVLLEQLPSDLREGFKSSTYVSGDPPRECRQFVLDRESALCLISGYDPVVWLRLIERWAVLEEALLRNRAPAPPSWL
jgi:phage regulator Rha-like protein